jgi:hypothetical protein
MLPPVTCYSPGRSITFRQWRAVQLVPCTRRDCYSAWSYMSLITSLYIIVCERFCSSTKRIMSMTYYYERYMQITHDHIADHSSRLSVLVASSHHRFVFIQAHYPWRQVWLTIEGFNGRELSWGCNVVMDEKERSHWKKWKAFRKCVHAHQYYFSMSIYGKLCMLALYSPENRRNYSRFVHTYMVINWNLFQR